MPMMLTRFWIAVILPLGWAWGIAVAQLPDAPSSTSPKPAEMLAPAIMPSAAKAQLQTDLTLTGVSPIEDLPQGLTSQQVAALFARWAYERYRAPGASVDQTAQAWILYRAALALDPRIAVQEDLLRVATSIPGRDLSGQVEWAYHAYASDPDLDLDVALRAVRYLVDRLQDPDSWVRRYTTRLMKSGAVIDRDLRRQLLSKLLEIAQTRNPVLTADLTIQGAAVVREQSNFPAVALMAISALDSDPYQLGVIPLILKDPEVYSFYMQLQFDRLLARQNRLLVKQDEVQYKAALERYEVLSFLRFRRLALQLDPMDPEAAGMFARFAENQRLYDLAAAGYEYVTTLAQYSSGQSPDMDATLMQIHYKDPAGREVCLQIADRIRRSGRFDLVIEGLAAKAADHLGRPDQARSILDQAHKQIEQLLAKDPNSPSVSPPMLAWFYAFVDPNPEKALAWANKAHDLYPQAPQVRALFGYALSLSSDPNLARDYVKDLANQDSIAALTLAKFAWAEGNKDAATLLLRQAVTIDSSMLAAEQAAQILTDRGQAPASLLVAEDRKILDDQFSSFLAPAFVPPSKRVSAKFSVSGSSSSMSFGRPVSIGLSIQNRSADPILFRDYGLLKGRIRIDAFVRGDLTGDLPRLIDTRIQPSATIAPGKSLLVPLQVDTGPLSRLLWTHPQANLDIELVGYLDPVPSETGGVRNAFPDVPAVRITLKRPGMTLSRGILMERLDSISKGKTAQKIQAAREMAGLWMEQVENAKSKISYRHNQVDPVVYLDALRRCLGSEDWIVVATTLSVLDAMPDPIPYEMVQAISPLLQNPNWPVRMMAMDLLSRSGPGQFQKVLDWAAASDPYPLVKELALSFRGKQVLSAPENPASEPPSAKPAPSGDASKKPGN
jgi:tetratricopeptide (TPR) repeat protein